MSENYKCLLCGKEFKSISGNHLSFVHNMTLQEYKVMFPEAQTSRPRVAWNKGIPTTQEHKQHLSEKYKQKYANGFKHWNSGNTTPEEVKQKIKEKSDIRNKEKREHKQNIQQLKDQTFQLKKEHLLSNLKDVELNLIHTSTHSTLTRLEALIEHKDFCKQHNLTLLKVEHSTHNALLIYTLNCDVCNNQFQFTNQYLRPCKWNTSICPFCNPREKNTSKGEQELYDFLSANTSLNLLQNDRIKLKGKELDIYIPELNIGIEYSGLYWHSEQGHQVKYNIFDKHYLAFDHGVRLITIFEDEWILKRTICEQRLLHILKQVKNKIPARKCNIGEVSFKETKEFLNQHHIQGTDISSIRLGAWYKEELIAIMTFKPTNMTKGGDGEDMELSRFCVKSGVVSSGLANKMFKYYLNNYPIRNIISYSDNRWNTGDLYKMLGFEYVDETVPNYWYIKPNCLERFHRSVFMKHKLVKQGFDPLLTEQQIMDQRGYYRIWDCGSTKWKYN